MIQFSVYNYWGICAKHGLIINGKNLCKICEANNDIKNGLIKSPTYGNNKHLTKMSWYISEFIKEYSQPMLKNYAYYRMSLCLLGKNDWKYLKR